MKQIALSIEQMNKLTSLGLDTSDASMSYIINGDGTVSDLKLYYCKHSSYNYPAYTLSDILRILPPEVICKKVQCGFGIGYFWWYKEYNDSPILGSDNALISAYDMLLWCIENNYIKTNKV